jgi:serine/threonine protein kinase
VATANPLNQPASNPSNVLGKFKLIAELGRGGMSEVYLAVIAGPAGFNKLVVVKLIKGELAEDPDFISMFLEEARLSARLSHPNVVQTNEVGEFGGRYYIAMEYLEGQAYSRILHRLGRDRGLPLGMSLRILTEVLQGLHYAHELADFDGAPLGVVHRDVTPHNVFVTYDGQVKVVDFGIAKAMNSSHETRTGMLKGKVGYMAPEQAKGERVDRRADIFSVGVMLWEAAVGKRLWKGLNEVQILHQLLAGDIPSPRAMRPDISQPLEQIIMKAVAVDRDRRHSSALELMGELEELMDSGSERATLREVGRLLTSTFEDERRKLKGIIEQQVAKSSMLATGLYQQVALPAVEQPALTGEVPRLSMGPVSGSMGSASMGSASMGSASMGGHGFPGQSYSHPGSAQSHPSMGSQPAHPSAGHPGAPGGSGGGAQLLRLLPGRSPSERGGARDGLPPASRPPDERQRAGPQQSALVLELDQPRERRLPGAQARLEQPAHARRARDRGRRGRSGRAPLRRVRASDGVGAGHVERGDGRAAHDDRAGAHRHRAHRLQPPLRVAGRHRQGDEDPREGEPRDGRDLPRRQEGGRQGALRGDGAAGRRRA